MQTKVSCVKVVSNKVVQTKVSCVKIVSNKGDAN